MQNVIKMYSYCMLKYKRKITSLDDTIYGTNTVTLQIYIQEEVTRRRIITFLSELKRCSLCLWLSSMPFHMARKNHRLLLSCSCRGEAKQSHFSISNAALALVLVVHPLFIYLLLAFNFNYSIRRPPTHGTARPNL